jgi:hypothetical protein
MLWADILNVAAGVISCLLTLMVFSYLLGDNPLFRLAVYIFIGVSAGFVTAIVARQVLYPQLIRPLILQQNLLALAIPLVLSLLLLTKIFPRAGGMGSPVMAFLVGTGAAVAIAGAISGTLVPQFLAALNPFDLSKGIEIQNLVENLGEGSIMLLGTITSLAYFHFGVKPVSQGTPGKRNRVISLFALIGQIFIAITLGVLFAGAYAASITALIERMYFIRNFIMSFLS